MVTSAEDGLQQTDDEGEDDEEKEQAESNGQPNPEWAAYPEPGPCGHGTNAGQLERQEDAEDHDGQEPERPNVDRGSARRGHCFLSLLVE